MLHRLTINGKTKLYGIVGNPVSHSFSPEMQTHAFQHLDLNAVYLPFPVKEPDLSKLLDAFWVMGVQGFNVTVPYKEKIVGLLSELSEEARFLGSVNTVRRTDQGWKGFCTDGFGFTRALTIKGIALQGKNIVLLGAGGAAKAISFALANAGVNQIVIINRTQEKASDLQKRLLDFNPSLNVSVNPTSHSAHDILINSTSVGMNGEDIPAAAELVLSSQLVIDIIYNPPLTALLKTAKNAGIAIYNGIDMLLYQGVEAFEIWTGKQAPVQVMFDSLKKSLAFAQEM